MRKYWCIENNSEKIIKSLQKATYLVLANANILKLNGYRSQLSIFILTCGPLGGIKESRTKITSPTWSYN